MNSSYKEKMLLLGALPRSGNHLIRAALDNHPELLTPPGEDYYVRNLVRSKKNQFKLFFASKNEALETIQKTQKNKHFESLNKGDNINLKGHSALIDLTKYYEMIIGKHTRFSTLKSLIGNHFFALKHSVNWNQTKTNEAYNVCFSALRPESNDLEKQYQLLSKNYDLKAIIVLRSPKKMISSVLGRNNKISIESLCDRHNSFIKQVTQLKEINPEKVLILSFEDFLLKKEKYIKKICNFLGIKMIPELLEDTLLGEVVAKNTSFNGNSKSVLNNQQELLIAKLANEINFDEI